MCTDCLALEVAEAASDSPADSEIRYKQQNKQNAGRVSVVQVSFNACVSFRFCSCYKVPFGPLHRAGGLTGKFALRSAAVLAARSSLPGNGELCLSFTLYLA